ncbi:MAG: epoxyqueuosine reductase [Thermodesulfobacteriota bacterium]
MSEIKSEDLGPWITSLIENFIERSPENTLQNPAQEKAFENPLVGFSSGADPLYREYKETVGPFHWTPEEIFSLTFPETSVRPEGLTVISWILPQTKVTRADNRKEKTYPSERWARARIYGEEVNVKLRKTIIAALEEKGIQAVAPLLSPLWEIKQSEKYVLASKWSERHAAYAAGLGTFGLCDGLITPRGKAMRAGSVVAALSIPPTPRPYTHHRAYCLFFTQGVCKKCIDRCPVGALSEAGHDKLKCLAHLKPPTADYVKSHYGFDGYGCGLCQTGVPCESKVPVRGDLEMKEEAVS